MKSTQVTGAILISAFLLLPMLASGEWAAGVMTAREAATGKATGRMVAPPTPEGAKHMMATGTKPMPPRMEEARERMMEKRSGVIKRFATQAIKHMKVAIERLTKIADRLDSRIAKEKARGVDTSKAEANIAIARTKLSDARAAIVVAEQAVAGAMASADLATSTTGHMNAGKPVREALGKAKSAVFAAHKALVDAISSLTGKRTNNATTTKERMGTP